MNALDFIYELRLEFTRCEINLNFFVFFTDSFALAFARLMFDGTYLLQTKADKGGLANFRLNVEINYTLSLNQ